MIAVKSDYYFDKGLVIDNRKWINRISYRIADLVGARRKIEYLVNMGLIRKVDFGPEKCGSCGGGCSSESGENHCKSRMPEGGFQHMGQMWEVVG